MAECVQWCGHLVRVLGVEPGLTTSVRSTDRSKLWIAEVFKCEINFFTIFTSSSKLYFFRFRATQKPPSNW